jgi:hypothetical protein
MGRPRSDIGAEQNMAALSIALTREDRADGFRHQCLMETQWDG